MDCCCEYVRSEGRECRRCVDERSVGVHSAQSQRVQPEDVEAETVATPNLIIGLGHKKRVGKDTFAELLGSRLEDQGYTVHRLAFAEALKEAAYSLFEVYGMRPPHHYEVCPEHREQPLEKINKTPRQLWIDFGNAFRAIHDDIWVDLVKREIERRMYCWPKLDASKPDAFIISDVRFPNEVEALKALGGVLVKVVRPDAPKSDDVADCALDGYEGWHWLADNCADIDWLGFQANALVSYCLYLHHHNIE